jgi:hypothetical protein
MRAIPFHSDSVAEGEARCKNATKSPNENSIGFLSVLSIPKFETWLRKNATNFGIGTLD